MYDPARDTFKGADAADEDGHEAASKSTPLSSAAVSNLKDTNDTKPATNPNGTLTVNQSASDQPIKEFNGSKASEMYKQQNATKRKRDEGEDEGAKKVKRKSDQNDGSRYESPVPMTSSNLPQFSKKVAGGQKGDRIRRENESPRKDDARTHGSNGARGIDQRRRDRSPPLRRSRSPVSSRWSRSPLPRRRSPTPPPRSPPRQRKRPGGASRMTAREKEHGRQVLQEREQAQLEAAKRDSAQRGVSDVVRQHYNAVPERGREWRNTDSRIKGLRSFNNWVKSAIIQKHSPDQDFSTQSHGGSSWADERNPPSPLKVLDIGCGKGGDLGKWQKAPQRVELYLGVDPADVSITQARERYRQLKDDRGRRGGRDHRDSGRPRVFHAEFYAQDAFGRSLGDIPLVQQVGFDDASGGAMSQRWGGGGFDVVSMMFCMHYAFETEEKAHSMLRNVSGSLKKGGRLIGAIPNSEVISERAIAFHKANEGKITTTESSEKEAKGPNTLEWNNSIYRVRFPGETPSDGVFRPVFGWKYSFFLEEAVEEVPEYVVPFGALRGMAEDYQLELRWMKPFAEVWQENRNDPILGPLSEQMRVCNPSGQLSLSSDEFEAASFYLAFVFEKL